MGRNLRRPALLLIAAAQILLACHTQAQEPAACEPPSSPSGSPSTIARDELRSEKARAQKTQYFPEQREPPASNTAPPAGAAPSTDASGPRWAFKGTLLPGKASRFLRPLSFSLAGIDQLDQVFDGTVDAETGAPNFEPNPTEDLAKVDITVKPGRLFRSTAELNAGYTLALNKEARKLLDVSSDPLRATLPDNKLSELAWSDTNGRKKRLLSALEATFGLTERSPFAGAAIIDREAFGEDNEEFVYAITLELDALVVFPGEILEAYQTLQNHTKLDAANRSGLTNFTKHECNDMTPVKCLRERSGIHVKGRWLAGLLPKISYKTVDQFDFILAGGEPFPLNEDSLETITVTWDLGSALDSAKHRRAAIQALALHRSLAARDERRDSTLELVPALTMVRIPHNFPIPVQLQAAYRVDGKPDPRKPGAVQWMLRGVTRLADSKEEQAAPVNAKTVGIKTDRISNGILAAWAAEPGSYELRFCLVDDVNNYSRTEQVVVITVENPAKKEGEN